MVKQAGHQGRGNRSDSKARGCESTRFSSPLTATEFSPPQVAALSQNLCRLQGPVDDGPDAPAGKNELFRGISASTGSLIPDLLPRISFQHTFEKRKPFSRIL